MSNITVLFTGYSYMDGDNCMIANCSCTLIKGTHNIIIDTMTPWDAQRITTALQLHGLTPDQIDYVISTHGHSDHIGNNNLFLSATHIVGFNISHKEKYFLHDFIKGEEYVINDVVKVIPTPGHTLSDVTILVKNTENEVVAIAGDLFERSEDIENPNLWLEAGSEDPKKQRQNRIKVAELADWIVPGHGPIFKVTDDIKMTLRKQLET